MRILFDHNAPLPLRHSLRDHAVETTAERGWDRLKNGELLDAAEEEGFDFQHQQNLRHRRIAIVILSRGNWPDIKRSIPKILEAVTAAQIGTCALVECTASFGRLLNEDRP